MKPKNCSYVNLSDLADISGKAAKTIQCLLNADLDVSFGDAEMTLVGLLRFQDLLDVALEQHDKSIETDVGANDIIGQLNKLQQDAGNDYPIYINLES